jgi:hydroxypyruvate reductase
MEKNLLKGLRSEAVHLFRASLESVNPFEAVRRFVKIDGGQLTVGAEGSAQKAFHLNEYKRIFIVGGGKATAPMAKAMEGILGSRITHGTINVKYGFTEELAFTKIVEGGHPLPDRSGERGTKKILALLEKATQEDLIFSLISGGGSALLPQPVEGVTLEEKQAVTKMLLDCGASIDEINAIRKHVSISKGGQMARTAFPATTINLMLSDVVGDRMDVIASGPFVPDQSTFGEAWSILEKYDLLGKIPDSVRRHLNQGLVHAVPETPKGQDPIFSTVHNLVIGSNILALEAAREAALKLGYQPLVLSSMVEGETRDAARVHAAIAKEIIKTGRPLSPPVCIISGGETTVTVRGQGKGGRNQEFGLSAAIDLKGLPKRVVILSGGTDGNDGPTEAAGAIVDPVTLERGADAGLDASAFLADNDAFHYLEKTGDLLITGPTNTNVMDVHLILVR